MATARIVFGTLSLLLLTNSSWSQPPVPSSPTSRPVFSPYLNLVRRDAPPGINYFGIVRPQLATQNSLQLLQQQINGGQQQQMQFAGQSVINPDLPSTGQQVFFLNTGGYFLNSRAGVGPINPALSTRGGIPTSIIPTPTRPTAPRRSR